MNPRADDTYINIRPRVLHWWILLSLETFLLVISLSNHRQNELVDILGIAVFLVVLTIFWSIYFIAIRIRISSSYIEFRRPFISTRIQIDSIYYLKLEGGGKATSYLIIYGKNSAPLVRFEITEFDLDTLRTEFGRALAYAPIGERLTWCRPYRNKA